MQGMHATRETDLSQSYFTQRPFKNRSIYKEEILENVKAFRGKNRWRQPLFENASFNCGHDQYFMRRFDMQSLYIYIYIFYNLIFTGIIIIFCLMRPHVNGWPKVDIDH